MGELRREQGWQMHRVAVLRDGQCLAGVSDLVPRLHRLLARAPALVHLIKKAV